MKKIIYLFALFLCVQIVLAQQDSSYLPLAVGNYWELKSNDIQYPDFEKYMVTNDTVMANGLKYYYLEEIINFNQKNNNPKFFKTESYVWRFKGPIREGISGNIYSYDTTTQSECLQYKISASPGESYISCIGQLKVYKDDIFYKDLITISDSYNTINLKRGIGIYSLGGDFYSYSLTKAMINNICVTCQPQVGVEKENFIPKTIKLYQNYPNPFNPETKINFDIPATGLVKLKVFSITGQEINSLVDETKPAGSYSIIWDGKDKNNLKLSSGVYFYQLTFSNNNNQTTSIKKMIFAK